MNLARVKVMLSGVPSWILTLMSIFWLMLTSRIRRLMCMPYSSRSWLATLIWSWAIDTVRASMRLKISALYMALATDWYETL